MDLISRTSNNLRVLFFVLITLNLVKVFAQDITVKIHVRGVAESKLTVSPLIGTKSGKPISEIASIRNGESTTISIPKEALPGEVILRFDYKEKTTSTPYPCERRIFVYNQNLELWVNPRYCSNNDSTFFQKNEKENTLFVKFSKENAKQKKILELLKNFLMNYDSTNSALYQQGIEEYEKRRNVYNQWITEQSNNHRALFVSHTFQLQYIPKIEFRGTPADKIQYGLTHYFDGINFNDSLLIHISTLKNFIDAYVNNYTSFATTKELRDSLLPFAGKTAIEKARQGHPRVYGWMVDYFYKGFESFNITAGITMLEPYLNDSNCYTSKRQAIDKRLKGIKTLTVSTVTPDFTLNNDASNTVRFHNYKTTKPYKLVLFWSADCGHCKDLVKDLYPWSQQLAIKEKLEIFALSLDDSSTEIPIWQNAITQLPEWQHLRCEGGINSKEANAYFILSTPVMILVDSKTNKILAMPENSEQLVEAVKNN